MQASLFFDVARTQTVVNNVDFVGVLVLAHAEVSWLYVTMNVLSIVNEAED